MKLITVAAMAALTLAGSQALALSADFAADFGQTTTNPNGAWTYGYTTVLGGDLNVFTTLDSTPERDLWYTPGVGDTTPSVFKNKTTVANGGLLGGEVGMHGGPGGQLAVARYTSSESTEVDISGVFGVGNSGHVGTYVLVDGVEKFGVASTGASQAFSFTTMLNVGSTVDFIVTLGDGTYNSDTTPLAATIETVPEPGSMALLLGGLAALRARRAKMSSLNS